VSAPEIAVVVPTHERPLRLRWLLNALEEQTLEPGRFEVLVAHGGAGERTEALLREHPLAGAGRLREVAVRGGRSPAVLRNAGWRAVHAPVIAFTDDDCRPPPEWLERALAAAGANPGVPVQGSTRPDPDELGVLHAAPWARSLLVDPPTLWAPTCNMVYPRDLLERLGGFDETYPSAAGEDADLALRAGEAGAPLLAAPEVLTYHAVHAAGLYAHLRSLGRWQHLAFTVSRHPALREALALRVFWKPNHGWLIAGAAGVAGARRHPALALAAVPWVVSARPSYGSSPRGRLRAVLELPGRALVDAAELAVMVRGSVRYRTLVL